MSLHHQLLRATRPLVGGGLLGVKVNRARAAIRVVVELHAPNDAPPWPTFCRACGACDGCGTTLAYPCETVQAIARELGVEAGEGRG